MTPVLFEKRGAIALVTLNRPGQLNAYNIVMRDALYQALETVRDDTDINVMILRGNGRAFCTGGDVNEFGSAPSPVAARAARWHRDNWLLLRSLAKPTIAAVHGYVVGGGLEMALLCDLCIAADNARFSYPETSLGMIPGVAGTQTTPRLTRSAWGLDLMLTGRWLTARDATRLGLVSRVVPRRELEACSLKLASDLVKLPLSLLATAKRAVDDGADLTLGEALQLERRLGSALQLDNVN